MAMPALNSSMPSQTAPSNGQERTMVPTRIATSAAPMPRSRPIALAIDGATSDSKAKTRSGSAPSRPAAESPSDRSD